MGLNKMMNRRTGLKLTAAFLTALTIAGCSSNDKPQVANPQQTATPGSERDFILNVGDRVHFIVDQSTLTPQAMDILRKQAAWLRQYPNVTIQIEGHADERGTREYNIALSARRATSTHRFLLAQGIAGSRMSTIAYGKERPVALCDAENCWNQNRRAVTVITGGAVPG